MSRISSGAAFGCAILVLVGIGGWAYWAGGLYEAWYSLRYWTPANQVQVIGKPTDCDFLHPPIGSKGCHYQINVGTFDAAGWRVGGDDAPRYDRDEAGKPIVSYDQGAHWQLLEGANDVPDPRVKRVVVTWIKVLKTD